MRGEAHRIEFVNHFEPRLFAEIVDAADVEQIVEGKIVAADFRDFAQISRENDQCGFAAELDLLLQFVAEQFRQRGNDVVRGHAVTGSASSLNRRFCWRNELSPVIFSCSFIKPSSKSSGRGGHPET